MEPREIMPGLFSESTPEGDVTIISVVGEVTPGNVGGALKFAAKMNAEPPRRLVLDFSRAERLRGPGVVLMGHYRSFVESHGGRMTVVSPSAEVVESLAPLDLPALFEVYAAREEAVAATRREREDHETADERR
jgi:anti-anti-sigma regulatory factor